MESLFEIEQEIESTRQHLSALLKKRREFRATPVDLTVEKEYEIWAEGFAVTGDFGIASMLGTGIGVTFSDAVESYKSTASAETKRLLSKNSSGSWSYWGCRVFPNESDARKSFG